MVRMMRSRSPFTSIIIVVIITYSVPVVIIVMVIVVVIVTVRGEENKRKIEGLDNESYD